MNNFPTKEESEKANLGAKYLNHEVFDEIEKYHIFYDQISMSTLSFVSIGTTALLNMDTYLYSSVEATLKSIFEILKKGRINDAYTLLRKYHDSIIINIYTNLYLKKEVNIDNFIVKKINDWLQGKEQLPDYRIMHNYIIKSDELVEIYETLKVDDRYKRIRDRCNDNTHYNFHKNIMLNISNVRMIGRVHYLDQFKSDISDLFILHLAYLFTLNGHYMASSDYMDHCEMGMKPIEGSENWVAPFIQDIFDTTVKQNRPDLAEKILKSTSMDLK